MADKTLAEVNMESRELSVFASLRVGSNTHILSTLWEIITKEEISLTLDLSSQKLTHRTSDNNKMYQNMRSVSQSHLPTL